MQVAAAALLLLAGPAAAQLRKITPVPPPSQKVLWHVCADAPLIGRFSGMLTCGTGARAHVETLVYQRNAEDEGQLRADISLSRSAADRGGKLISGVLTESEDGAGLELSAEETSPEAQPAPVKGVFKRLAASMGAAVYDVKLPKIQQGRLKVGKSKGHVILTFENKTSCEGDLKKTQTFKVVCE